MLTAPIAYSSRWPEEFRTYKTRLHGALEGAAGGIDHIGSTAVPGLSAKPIIDIQVGLASLDHFNPAALTDHGFTPVASIRQDDAPVWSAAPQSQWHKRYARLEGETRRRAHIHFRVIGAANHRFALVFRDYLRAHPDACDLYGQMKAVASRIGGNASDPGGSGTYLDIKDPFVALLGKIAWDWAQSTGWTYQTET